MLALLASIALSTPALAEDGPDSAACVAAAKTAGEGKALEADKLTNLDAACLELVALAPQVRHGFKLREDAQREFFMAQGLYAPTPSFNAAQMSAVDHENVKLAGSVGEDKAARAAVAGGEVYALGPGCATPEPGPITVLCLDGSRATAKLNSVDVSDSPSGPVWNFDLTRISGDAVATERGCVVMAGHQGVRSGGAKPDAAFESALGKLCAGRGTSCSALAGDLDGDGLSDGLIYVSGEGRAGALSTELYVQGG
ncbi:MAG: hypothetical protein H6740_16565, partial [Alphaproteobacteria bacterium]|nr:hypothetical protein [Alphaproteobacteria bacterium]